MKIVFRGLGASALAILLASSDTAEALKLLAFDGKQDQECSCNCTAKQEAKTLAQIDAAICTEEDQECSCNCKQKSDGKSLAQVEMTNQAKED